MHLGNRDFVPPICQPVHANPTQTDHNPTQTNPTPLEGPILVPEQQFSLPNQTPPQAHLHLLIPTEPQKTALVELHHFTSRPKWKKMAKTTPLPISPVHNHNVLGSSKRKSEDSSYQEDTNAAPTPKQRRLNGISREDSFSSAEVAKQPRRSP